jgi:hypothetical protein
MEKMLGVKWTEGGKWGRRLGLGLGSSVWGIDGVEARTCVSRYLTVTSLSFPHISRRVRVFFVQGCGTVSVSSVSSVSSVKVE